MKHVLLSRMTRTKSKTESQCQGDSPPSLDLLRISIPLVRGVFPGQRYFVLVSLVGEPHADGTKEIVAVEGDIFLRFPD